MATYEEALECWRRHDASQAEALCQSLLQNAIEPIRVLRLLAEIYGSTGRASEAIVCLQPLLPLLPEDAALRRQLGNLQLTCDAALDAAASYQEALRIEPGSIRAHNNLGQALLRLGRAVAADVSFRQAIALDPGYAIAHNNLGTALERQGLVEQALASYQRAAALNPGLAEAHCNGGHALARLRRLQEALSAYDQALRCRANLAEALLARANTLQKLQQYTAALGDYQQLLSRAPDHTDALCGAAAALLALNRPTEALQLCERALRCRTDLPEVHLNLAGALRELDRRAEALLACERALALRPGDLDALCNRGRLLREIGDHEAAIESFRRALSIDPEHAEARSGLPMAQIPAVPADAAQVTATRAAFLAELDRFLAWLGSERQIDEPAVVGRSQVFYLAYQEATNKDILVRYGRVCCELMQRWLQRQAGPAVTSATTSAPTSSTMPHSMPPSTGSDSRIRVGIASAYIREHSVYRALIDGWLRQLDPERFEIAIFHLDTAEDALTASARSRAAFYVGGALTLPEWVDALRAAELDALIYPEIGMHPLTLRLASLRLLPCQMVSWGHPETSGLPTMDYYLSAAAFESAGSDVNYSEKLVRLAHLGCYYEPFDCPESPLDFGGLGIDAERPLLICPGTPFKYAPACDEVWVEIARRLGRCQLLFFEPREAHLILRLRERLTAVFRAAGLSSADYLRFVPWQAPAQFHALLRRADVFLDTIGFSGFNTAMQAAECHLPLVTYEGRFMRGRFGSAIAARMGLPQLITRSLQDYVELAVRLAQEAGFRQDIRERMRVASAALFRDRASIDSLAAFLVDAVRRTPRHRHAVA